MVAVLRDGVAPRCPLADSGGPIFQAQKPGLWGLREPLVIVLRSLGSSLGLTLPGIFLVLLALHRAWYQLLLLSGCRAPGMVPGKQWSSMITCINLI